MRRRPERDLPVSEPGRLRRVLVWLLWSVAVVEGVTVGLSFLFLPNLLNGLQPAAALVELSSLGAVAAVVITFATAGLLVVGQRPTHPVGWLMMSGGLLVGVVFIGAVIGASLVEDHNPLGPWVFMLAPVLFVPAIFLVGPAIAMVFPDGRLPSARWRWPLGLSAAIIGIGSVAALVRPGALASGSVAVNNPLGISGSLGQAAELMVGLMQVVLAISGLVAMVSLIVRYRRGNPEERLQLKWFISAVAVWAIVLPFAGSDNLLTVVALVGLALVPVSVVIAILRYRLYDIDTLINRTLVYVPLVAIVAGLFAACTVLLQRAFVAITGNTSDAATVISALILAAVFTPIRNALQSAVDKRFKPADADGPGAEAWRGPEFELAVERIVRRVMRQGDHKR